MARRKRRSRVPSVFALRRASGQLLSTLPLSERGLSTSSFRLQLALHGNITLGRRLSHGQELAELLDTKSGNQVK